MNKMMIAAGAGILALCSMASADALLLYQDSDDNTAPPPDAAEDAGPWYLTADMGVNFAMNANAKDSVPDTKFKFKPGLGMNIGVGYNFTKMFGLELSSGLQWNKVKELAAENLPASSSINQDSGDLYQIPFVANFVVNFNVTDKFDIALVAGIGMQWTKFKSQNTLTDTTLPGKYYQGSYDHDSIAFRYNVGLRMNYAITHNVRLGANFLFTGSTEVNIGNATAVVDGIPAGSGWVFNNTGETDDKLKDLMNFSIGFGVEWTF